MQAKPIPSPPARARQIAISELMLLIAGAAMGFWLMFSGFGLSGPGDPGKAVGVIVSLLGGLSFVGPPLLLLARRRERTRRPFRPGELLWFSQGMASWLLWPPMIYLRAAKPADEHGGMSGVCYFWGTPLMAVYVTFALLAGGWIRPRSRRRRPRARSWRERFGLLLGMAWACTGLYLLYLIYKDDFKF